MEWLGSNSMYMMERSMNFLWMKQTATLDNIANAETPGYKAKYVTFEETLREKIRASANNLDSVSAFRDALENTNPQVQESP
ncbi:MAG: flgB, partial [Firmicutes bacterium]|nr:flgB [Bacillota bacterium]